MKKVIQIVRQDSGGSYEYTRVLAEGLSRQYGIQSQRISFRSRQQSFFPLWKQSRRKMTLLTQKMLHRIVQLAEKDVFHRHLHFESPGLADQLRTADLIHIHGITNWLDPAILLRQIPRHIPVICTLHDLWMVTGGCVIFNGCEQFRERCEPCPILRFPFNHWTASGELKRKQRAFRDRVSLIVTNSGFMADLVKGSTVVGNDISIRQISPPVDENCFLPGDRGILREKFGFSGELPVLLAGAISLNDQNKNMQWLLCRLSEIRECRPFQLLLFGEGEIPIPDNLETTSVGRIEDRRKMAELYQVADLFVSASKMETYGMTLVESLACGTPVVAFRTGGTGEAVDHLHTGVLCEPGDADSFREGVMSLLDQPMVRKKMGESGHQRVSSRNRATSFVSRYHELYQEVYSANLERFCDG